MRTADPKRIEVTEYFTYACGHCFQFEPLVNRWKSSLPADVAFNRTPAIWGKDHQFLAQVYYTLSAMGVLESMHLPLFQALHQERRQILDPQAMAAFLAEHGISPEDFGQRFASFEVKHAVQKADARGRAYRASGTPALVVNGKYLVETSMAGSPAAMLEVASFLVARERALLEGDPAAE